MVQSHKRSRGSTLIEFTLVGIPVIFLLISVFEISRGLWLHHTLASAVRDGTRLAVVHGTDCNLYPNSCAIKVRDIAERISRSAIGFRPSDIENLTFVSATRTITCPTLADCLTASGPGDTYWPSSPPGAPIDVGGNRRTGVEIGASFRFESAIAMFWAGTGRGQTFPAVTLPASSRELIQY